MANNFIPLRFEYSGGSAPTGWAEYQTGETAAMPGNLNFTGNGRRITGDMSAGGGSFANRLIVQSSVASQTQLSVMPGGGSVAGVQLWASATDLENSPRFDMTIDGSVCNIGANRVGTGAYLPLTVSTGGVERIRANNASGQGQVHIHTGGANPMGSRTPGAMVTTDCSLDIYNPNAQGRCLGMAIGSLNGGVGNIASFYYNPGSLTFVGSISTNGTTTSYNTTSDRRLKDQIEDADADEAWSRLDGYCIRSFVFKSMPDVRIEYAGIADELQLVNPDMVTGEKNAVLAYGTVYTFRPVGTLHAQDGEVIAVEVEEPEEYSGYWHPTGAREFVEREDVLPPTDELPGKRWEKTREEILPQAVDWSKAVPELILNLQTAKAKIIALEVRAAEQDARITDLETRLQQLLNRLSA